MLKKYIFTFDLFKISIYKMQQQRANRNILRIHKEKWNYRHSCSEYIYLEYCDLK